MIDFVCDDVLSWAKNYKGDKFHALLSDYPAGIFFMGREWDSDHGGRDKWISVMTEITSAMVEHLHPGAHCIVWALPRVSHWTATALENAGLEVRDVVTHVFGCLSDDTEILTENGWEQYQTLVAGSRALCYNIGEKSFKWESIQEVLTYDYEDTAYHIKSDTTDQIVSRNHRCIVERSGSQVFRYAEALQCQESVPVLESLSALLKALPVPQQRASGAQQVLRTGMRKGRFERTAQRGAQEAYTHVNLPTMQQAICNQEQQLGTKILLQDMLRGLESGQPGNKRTSEANSTQGTQWLDGSRYQIAQRTHDGREEPCMEGRRNLLQNAWELYRSQVCEMPAGIQENGTQRRLRNGTPFGSSPSHRTPVVTDRGCTSRQWQSGRQPLRKLRIVRNEQRPQAIRASRFTRSTLATVTPIDYKGVVWCVRVPSGAFVARRNGKVFITGNSGFPKSENVGKRLDKMAGAEREVIGTKKLNERDKVTYIPASGGGYNGIQSTPSAGMSITAPATDAARTWEGYGSALKPASEHWIIARKPLIGTIAENCLQTGAGALNIDSARIGSADNLARLNRDGDNGWKNSSGGPNEAARREAEGLPQLGRWPANFVLSHSADCEYVGVKRVKGTAPAGRPSRGLPQNGMFVNANPDMINYADADGYETVQEWRCSESCAVRLLGEQSGELKSGAKTRNKVDPIPTGGKYGIYGDWEALCDGASFQGDTGTAARFFFNADFSLDQQEAIDNAAPFFYAAKASSKERSAGLEDMVQLRKDLTDDERAYVMAELAKVGLIV